MSNYEFMDQIKDIPVLLFTRGDGRPDAFAPAHARLAAGALGAPSIDYLRANLAFRAVIRRLYIRLRQEAEVIDRRTDRIGEYELEEEDSPGSGTYTWNLTGEAFFLQYNRARYYLLDRGRWIARDPAGYVDGMNLYEYVGSNPVTYVDPSGLWRVDRKGQARADAEAETNDTPRTLGTKIYLSPSEFKKWMKLTGKTIKTADGPKTLTQLKEDSKICPKERVTVPNTGYIDVGNYSWGFLGWYLMVYKSGLNHRWSNEGLRVVYTGKWSTTKDKILGHLGSDDIYKFAFIGHGAIGCMTTLSGGDGVIVGDQYTPFGIAEMQIIACESNDRAWGWKKNVSKLGVLRTVKGKLKIHNMNFVDESGSR